ncbi:MAG: phosphoglucomutase/phosphomannomutase family protein [Cyanobacteriota bacterium]|nr:phosphoglucomutase/phosphomannomutase family protein [Cyanobacteriota bacterium]
MSACKIRFGTDGWRAVIADGFTVERVKQVAQASAQVLAATFPGDHIVVGYDHRFLSEQFAAEAAAAVAALGIPVHLSQGAAPTPAFSWAVRQQGSHGALVITASHNPPEYSGMKVKGSFGGSIGSDLTQQIEQILEQSTLPMAHPSPAPITSFDPWPDYCAQLSRHVDLEKLRRSPAKVWVDVMHGSGAGGMARLLGSHVEERRANRDPLFGGYAPEPLPKALAETMQMIAQTPHPLKVGLVFDGDADRIAAIDGQGRFLSPQILIPILIEHLAERRGWRGEVVKTVSGSELFRKVADRYHLPVTETPVGFKYIAERMMTTPVLLGGEESGGIGYLNHMPERDAMLSALYLLEAVADTGLDLSQIYATIQNQVAYHSVYRRRDLRLLDPLQPHRLLQQLHQDPPQALLGQPVLRHFSQDGHKFSLGDGSWLMIRGSGTEPLLRLYAEAEDLDRAEALLNWAETWATP